MTQTSDTEFYSLSLNSLEPPPYSTPAIVSNHFVDVETANEKQQDPFAKSFVPRFTPPFLRTSASFPQDQQADKGSRSLWTNIKQCIRDLIVGWWLWELLSWFISALCIFGIAMLLGYWDGRAVPDRWPLGVTLNAYIAILSGITKYTLAVPVDNAIGQAKWHWLAREPRPLMDIERFDDASRGPVGSLLLICRVKLRSIASLGAVVTVLSLAMDPFFQQLIDLPKRPSAINQSAVPRMVNFELQRNIHQNSTSGEDIIAPDRLMQDVVFSYMVNNGTNRDINVFCPSADCAWKPFDTLAMCSSCTDVSDLLTLACLEESGDWRRNVSVNEESSRSFSCGYFANATSDNPVLMTGYALNTSSAPAEPLEYLLMRSMNLQDVNVDKTYWGGSIKYPSASFPLVDFVQVATPNVESIMNSTQPVARECVVQWCTKRIIASYEAGEYKEQVLSEAYDTEAAFDALQFGEDMFFTYSKNISISPPDSNVEYTVPNSTVLSSVFLFQEFFPSYLVAANDSATPLLRTRNLVGDFPRHWLYPTNVFSAFEAGNEYVQNMTHALTNTIRSYPGTSELFRGSGGMETYISVRWPFLTLPILLLCLALVLLAVVILQQRKEDIGIWKASVLAALAHGLPDRVKELFQSTAKLSDVFDRSSELRVKLCKDPEKGHFGLRLDDK